MIRAVICALLLLVSQPSDAHTLALDTGAGLYFPAEKRAWGERAASLFKRVGLGKRSIDHDPVIAVGLRYGPNEWFEVGAAYRRMHATLDAGGPDLAQLHETTVHAPLLDLRVSNRTARTVAFLDAVSGPWRTEVAAHGHLGDARATAWSFGAEVTGGCGLRFGPVELTVRLGYSMFDVPKLEGTYYAVGGDGGGLTLGAGLGAALDVGPR